MPKVENLETLLDEVNKLLNKKEPTKTWFEYLNASKKGEDELSRELTSRLEELKKDTSEFKRLSKQGKNFNFRYTKSAEQYDDLIKRINIATETNQIIKKSVAEIATNPDKSLALAALEMIRQSANLNIRQMAILSHWKAKDSSLLLSKVANLRILCDAQNTNEHVNAAINELNHHGIEPTKPLLLTAEDLATSLSCMTEYLMDLGTIALKNIINSKDPAVASAVDKCFKAALSGICKSKFNLNDIASKTTMSFISGDFLKSLEVGNNNYAQAGLKGFNKALGASEGKSPWVAAVAGVSGIAAGVLGTRVSKYSERISPDISDIAISAVIGALSTGTIDGAATCAIQRRIYNSLWKATGGKAALKGRSAFIKPTLDYCFAKGLSEYAPQIGAAIIGQISNYLALESAETKDLAESKLLYSTLATLALASVAIASAYNWTEETKTAPLLLTNPTNSKANSPKSLGSPKSITRGV